MASPPHHTDPGPVRWLGVALLVACSFVASFVVCLAVVAYGDGGIASGVVLAIVLFPALLMALRGNGAIRWVGAGALVGGLLASAYIGYIIWFWESE